MCGIAGYIASESAFYRNLHPQQVLQPMVAALSHRGPDDSGIEIDAHGGLGMRRLSIVGLDNGHQPIASEDGGWHVVGNGEIYNAPQLRRELENRGHRFSTRSDIEVALHLFEDVGTDAFSQLNGMFALAFRHRDGRTLIVRDRLGIKPLFWTASSCGVLFASEIPALRAGLTGSDRSVLELDPQALHDYLRLGYVSAPRTIHRGIRQLPPGHFAWLRGNDRVQSSAWWELPNYADDSSAAGAPRSVAEYADELVSLMRSSVDYRTLGDVQAGAFLSGGLDSTTLVGLLSKSLEVPVPTFTLGFGDDDKPDEDHDEIDDARISAAHFGCTHFTDRIGHVEYDEIGQLFRHFGEPFADVSLLATDRVSKLASQHVKFVISGDGGDELFAGYSWLHREVRWRRLPAPLLGAARALQPMLGLGHRSRRANLVGRALRALADLSSPAEHSFLRRRSLCSPWLVPQLLHPRMREQVRFETPLERHVNDWRGGAWELLLDLDRRFYLANDILAKVDRASMRHSLEARVPLLDHRIVEWAAQVPVSTHIGQGRSLGKGVLRDAIGQLLPPELLNRRKRGFGIPIDRWLRGPLFYEFEARLRSRELRDLEWLDDAWVAQLLREHGSGQANHGHLLWGLCSLAEFGASVPGASNTVDSTPLRAKTPPAKTPHVSATDVESRDSEFDPEPELSPA